MGPLALCRLGERKSGGGAEARADLDALHRIDAHQRFHRRRGPAEPPTAAATLGAPWAAVGLAMARAAAPAASGGEAA